MEDSSICSKSRDTVNPFVSHKFDIQTYRDSLFASFFPNTQYLSGLSPYLFLIIFALNVFSMIGNWILLLGIILIVVVLYLAINRYRNFLRQEKLFHQIGQRFGLEVAFLSSRVFTVFGSYRSYTVQIESFQIPTEDGKATYGLKAHIPMINPNRKALRVANPQSTIEGLHRIATIDKAVVVQQGMGNGVKILTNDILFSGIILSDDVKISLYKVFQEVGDGLLYLYDDELAFIWPTALSHDSQIDTWGRIVDLLCDMKEELVF